VPRGAKQIVIPMTQQQYDDVWHDAERVRSFIEQCARSFPELFRDSSLISTRNEVTASRFGLES
jgi:hypothetical protein